MSTEKKMTGYPSIDKPWLKYYTEKEVAFDINKTIYDNFKTVAEENIKKQLSLAFAQGKRRALRNYLSKLMNLLVV